MEQTKVKRTTTVTIEGPLVKLVDRYIDNENRRLAPGKLSFNALVQAALVHYITKRSKDEQEVA